MLTCDSPFNNITMTPQPLLYRLQTMGIWKSLNEPNFDYFSHFKLQLFISHSFKTSKNWHFVYTYRLYRYTKLH